MGKDRAQLVIAHPADEAGPAPQLGDAGQGVGGGAAGGFQARADAGVEPLGLGFIHQGHGALGQAVVIEDVVLGLDQHINNGVADADDIEAGPGGGAGLGGLRHGQRTGEMEWGSARQPEAFKRSAKVRSPSPSVAQQVGHSAGKSPSR